MRIEDWMTKSNEMADLHKPVVENAQRPGTVLRLILLALVLIGTAAAFVWFRDQLESEVVLGILGVLAMAGIFFLVSAIIGFVEVMPQNHSDTVSRAVLNSNPDGMVITDRKGRIIYANAAYGRLTGADSMTGVLSIEHLLSRNRESTEAVYRLTNGLMEGKSGYEEFRLPRPLGRTDALSSAWWYRLKARPLDVEEEPGGPFFVWQISDITADRDEQEKFFRELQNAIDYLDHAPAGFFSAGRKGEIFYVNATLADWLGIDLTKFQSGSIMIRDICAGEGLTRLETIHPEAGQVRTETLDVDFRKSNGQQGRRAGRKPHHRLAAHGGRDGPRGGFLRRDALQSLLQQHADGHRLRRWSGPHPAHQHPVHEAVFGPDIARGRRQFAVFHRPGNGA
jgi:two-component system cell cycle sensor histidine kinase/response regulator CckA